MIWNYDHFSKRIVEYTFKKTIHKYSSNINKKNDVFRQLQVFLVISCKHFYSKIPFYEKTKMTTRRPIVLGSFVMVGSFDCDLTFLWEK